MALKDAPMLVPSVFLRSSVTSVAERLFARQQRRLHRLRRAIAEPVEPCVCCLIIEVDERAVGINLETSEPEK